MPHFIDNQNRTWQIGFTVALAKHIRTITGLDFINAHDGKALQAIAFDDEKLVQVIWLLCAAQCQAAQVDEEAFGMALAGDELGSAMDAIQEALVLFSRPDKRPAMQAILDRGKKAKQKAVDYAVAKVNSDRVSQAIDRTLEQADRKIDQDLDALMDGNL
jgi:hypothetical protein